MITDIYKMFYRQVDEKCKIKNKILGIDIIRRFWYIEQVAYDTVDVCRICINYIMGS